MTDPRDTHQAAVDAEVAAFRRTGAVIEQAKGVLIQMLAIDEGQAFSILSRYSQHHNIKLVDLAARLVDAASREKTPTKDVVEGAAMAMLDELAGSDPER